MNKHIPVVAAACAASLGAAAQAHTMQGELSHHAAQQSRIAADEARGRVDAGNAAMLRERAATVERVEADALSLRGHAASLQQLVYAERDLDHALTHAEHAKQAKHSDAIDRMHARVASARVAEQQHWIAAEFRHGTLDRESVAQIEREQAEIATQQAAFERKGHESVDDALRVQHLQDVQDWEILGTQPSASHRPLARAHGTHST